MKKLCTMMLLSLHEPFFFHVFHTIRCLFQPTISADPPIIYHATVVAPAKFIELDDVSNLKNHLGKNRATCYFIKLIQNRATSYFIKLIQQDLETWKKA